jgi:mono/diheme cytochrome c family protein
MSERVYKLGVGVKTALMLVAFYFGVASAFVTVQAQSGNTARKSARTDQEKRGQAIFVQRCSICHLSKLEDAQGRPGVRPFKSFGPSLNGVLPKDADLDQVTAVRQFILHGTDRMPGFQYALQPNEIDNIVAFLKIF